MNHPASEFVKFKKKKLNLSPVKNRKQEKRIAVCPKCKKKSDKIIKNKCNRCYSLEQGAIRRKRKEMYGI